jgi:hypothetical protein
MQNFGLQLDEGLFLAKTSIFRSNHIFRGAARRTELLIHKTVSTNANVLFDTSGYPMNS